MFTSTPLSLLSFIMESMQKLDSTLIAFWEGFPCPPPWNEELLFRLNWTGCVGLEMGEKVKLYMADKCNIRHDGKSVLTESGDETEDDGVLVEDECGLTCQLIIGVMSVLFVVLLVIVLVVCVRRHRAKPASPSHQSSLTSHPDNAKYYTSCHYACAPVVARQLQTTLNGDRLQTSVLPSGANTNNGHYHPGSYPQHSCQQLNYHHSRHQQLQQPCLIITPYGQVPAHTSSLVVPQHSRYGGSHYRKQDGVYTSSSSDRSPVYESIGDTDSLKEHGRGTSFSECEFCECGGDHGSEHSGYTGYHDPIILGDDQTHSEVCTRKLAHPVSGVYSESGSVCLSQTHEDPPGPCPPMFMDGYYGDKCPQTLPLRPLRGNPEQEDGKQSEYNNIESDELCPLNRKNISNQTADEKSDMRRRPTSGNCFSNNGSQYREGGTNSPRRVIPALHPNYFVAPYEEIS